MTMTFFGFDMGQLDKATDYYNLCNGASLDREEVARAAFGLQMPGEARGQNPASTVVLFWRSKRIDMPGEIKIWRPDGFWGRH